MECALDSSGVTKRFGATVAVDDLALRLEPGVFVGLLGRNGAGKTTTMPASRTGNRELLTGPAQLRAAQNIVE